MKLTPTAFYQLIIQPNFQDITPEYNGSVGGGWLSRWTVMPKVNLNLGQNLIDVTRKANILQRKGRTCKTNWATVGDTANRKIAVQELVGAVQHCQEEFYDGCMKDFRDNPEVFQQMTGDFFREALGLDIYTNSYFGSVGRQDNASWSLNKYDGVVTKIGNYITNAGANAPQVTAALPSGAMTPLQAYTALMNLVTKRTPLMKASRNMDLAIHIDYNWAFQYMQYLIATGNGSTLAPDSVQNGIPVLKFMGIPIYVENLWDVILQQLNGGTEAHMGWLTLDGNMVFGTNDEYGGGAMLNQAMRVWYDENEDIWKWKADLCAGTEILSPANLVFSITNGLS